MHLDGRKINLGRNEIAAWAEYHRLMSDHRQTVVATQLTAVHLLDAYYRWCVQHRAANTANSRKGRLRSFGQFIGAKLLAAKVKPHHVQSWLTDRYPDANPTTLNTLIGVIKGAFAWGTRMGHLESAPIASMPKPTPLIDEEFIPCEDWLRLLAAAPADRRRLLELCLETNLQRQ